MKKRSLSQTEERTLRAELQAATLAALMDSRRWEPGDIAFQGGTSLHLAHGSARFSEDLDFMIRGGLSTDKLAKELGRRLKRPLSAASDLALSVTAHKGDRNPHHFYVTLSGPTVLGSVKVKVELWQTNDAALRSLQLLVSTVATPTSQTFVPTLTLSEIFCDKVYALGARERIKPRDLFDLWWLVQKGQTGCSPPSLLMRLEIYPAPSGRATDTAARWLQNAALRLTELGNVDLKNKVTKDLARWLPSFWPVNETVVEQMIAIAVAQLTQGIQIMQAFSAAPHAPESPSLQGAQVHSRS